MSTTITVNGHVDQDSKPEQKKKWLHDSGRAGYPQSPDYDRSTSRLNPDEMFVKHPVTEIGAIRQKLRADADAKQEDLRSMVGERYRDVLHASSAIISIARSSECVKEALRETKAGVLSQKLSHLPRRHSLSRAEDGHLNILQLLSAHIKLLLDTPEHLWRLIERKKYFSATWLFLLARVVHRALARRVEEDESSWSSQGVDVLEQFPLVKRQWDAISQFRSQIVHKATLSLREDRSSIEDVCAVLLTLHFLDSQPLYETLTVLLAQRTKNLQSKLSWKSKTTGSSISGREVINREREPSMSGIQNQNKMSAFEIKETIHALLDTISDTVSAVDRIYQQRKTSSLLRQVLQHLQSDSSTQPEHNSSILAELFISTPSLLATLPSASHFQLLPSNLRSYKPLVDLTSQSSSIDSTAVHQKINDWFRQATSIFQPALERWLGELQNVRAVWSIRLSARGWMLRSCLNQDQLNVLKNVLDDACQCRIREMWKLRLDESFESFKKELELCLTSDNDDSRKSELHLAAFLFQAPPFPTSHSTLASINHSFQEYKLSLMRQIRGRTIGLNTVLMTLESCARKIRQDFAILLDDGDQTRQLADRLQGDYMNDADAFCISVAEKLEQHASNSRLSFNLMFLGRVANDIASSSALTYEIGCRTSTAADIRAQLTVMHNKAIDRWRNETISWIVGQYSSNHPPVQLASTGRAPSDPSPTLIKSLHSLSLVIQERAIWGHLFEEQCFAQESLHQFALALINGGWKEGTHSVCDLLFLKKVLEVSVNGCISDLSVKLREIYEKHLSSDLQQELDKTMSESLLRMQNLFASLLPRHTEIRLGAGDKSSSLFPLGQPPTMDLQFQTAIELAQPAARFGLLSVSHS